jgi:hypothetical protein
MTGCATIDAYSGIYASGGFYQAAPGYGYSGLPGYYPYGPAYLSPYYFPPYAFNVYPYPGYRYGGYRVFPPAFRYSPRWGGWHFRR